MRAPPLLKPLLIRAAMIAARPFYGGIGAVHMLHRIMPESERSRLGDNRALEITPDDLDAILRWMKERSYDFITLDELPGRLQKPRGRKFACFTFDDGYRDNLLYALPIFEKYNIPFAVNITTGFTDHTGIVWWHVLEDLLRERDHLAFRHGGRSCEFATGTLAEKSDAFKAVAQLIRDCDLGPHESLLAALFEEAPFDPLQRTRDLIMDWDEVKKIDAHPLVTIGAHGIHHLTSSRLDDPALRRELAGSKRILEDRLGHPVRHLAYPFGSARAVGPREFLCARECGFTTALTTRSANLFREHAAALDRLPRISVSGNYQAIPCLERLESGLVCARANRWKRVVTE